jgi:hypothetical protein
MSSEIACIPQWKLALMERKRRQDKDGLSAGARSDGTLIDMNGLPTWKKEILAKKQQQKNTFVFMARSPARTTKDTDHDQTEQMTEHCDSVVDLANGHADIADHNKRRSCPPNIMQEMVDSERCNNNWNSVSCKDEEIVERPVEERLLPIHRNPILRLDIEKRHHSSSQSTRSSSSPRSGSESVGCHDRLSGIEETNHITSPGIFVPADTELDVFSADETNDEVTYGRGFVHKLLIKFSHLAASDQSVATPSPPRPSLPLGSTSGPRGSVGGTSYGQSRTPSAEAESLSRKRFISSRAKCHSVDDLLGESDFNLVRGDLENNFDVARNGDISGINGHGELDRSVSQSCALTRKNSVAEAEELPITNIVSNTRSLFENLVTSPQHSSAVLNSSLHNRFSYSGTPEKTKGKHPETAQPVSSIKDLEQLPATQNGSTKLSCLGASKENSCDEIKTVTNHVAGNNDSSSNAVNSVLPDAACVQMPDEVSKGNGIVGFDIMRASRDMTAERAKFPAVNGYINDGSSNNLKSSVVQDMLLEKKPADKVDKVAVSHAVPSAKSSVVSNQDVIEKVSRPSEVRSSVSSNSIIHTAVTNSSTGNVTVKFSGQKAGASNGVSDKNQPSADQEKASITPSRVTNTVPKAGPSRPGMLLIRPASNLVAANTKTEYLSLTKYNDVRKGEFAPAVRKVTEQSGDDESVNEFENDVTDAAPDVDRDEQFIFAGAGVHLSRSLLDKTKQGKRVSYFHFGVFL